MYGVRQGSVLFWHIFAVYLDDLSKTCTGRFSIVYADDISLISTSVVDLEKLFRFCERKLNW